jgi:outer membrane protein assembly factor BamB
VVTNLRFLTATLAVLIGPAYAENWPQWRGPSGSGVSPDKGVRVEWSNDKNIAWRAELGGLGVSSPIVWSQKVFVTYQTGTGGLRQGRHPSFVQEGNPADLGETPLGGARAEKKDSRITFAVAAYDANDGRNLWRYSLDAEGELPDVHEKRNLATSSPATDGSHVYSWFSNGQLVALDLDGKLAWKRHIGKDYAPFELDWGHSSSPVVYRDRLILLCYHKNSSYLLALDKKTGKELWKVDRGADLKSYSTPLVIEPPQGAEIVVNSSENVEAFDPMTGKSLWKFIEPTRFAVPMPVYQDGVLYISRGYRSGPYMALKAGQRGELTKDKLLWHSETGAPYTSSLVYTNGLLFMATEMGIVTCLDAKTGERVWRERLGGIYSASPVAADGHVYLFGESGETLVLKASRKPELVARNKVNLRILGSPAFSGGRIFLRGDRQLVAISAASK